MKPSFKIVISASRRTDIPAFYMQWFMNSIKQGFFEISNPYNRKVSVISASPDNVHTIVFWSKNFGPFLEKGAGKNLKDAGYNLFFNFTINSTDPLLEPNLPELNERLSQLERLCEMFDPISINWRFDPVCFYKTGHKKYNSNLADFSKIAEAASQFHIKRCITSFMDHYPKIHRRTRAIPGFSFIDPPIEHKKTILIKMEKLLSEKGISLQTCCESELLNILPDDSLISGSSCIPNHILLQIFGGKLSVKKHTGQRTKQGCGCRVSVDVGSYGLQPCYNNCLFCYANPEKKPVV
jgi:hypothetical protein